MMIELINSSYWAWFGLAITLVIIELMLGSSFFLIGLSISASLTGILKWLVPEILWQYQILFFSAVSILSIAVWRQYLRKQSGYPNKATLNQKSTQFIGKIYTLSEPISNGKGKMIIGDSVWLVTGPDLAKGSAVRVVAMEGTVLTIQPLS